MPRTELARPDRVTVDHPQPSSVTLLARDFCGYVSARRLRRGERQVPANYRIALLSPRKPGSFGNQLCKEMADSLVAANKPTVATVNYRVRLKQSGHSFHIASLEPHNERRLEILRIVDQPGMRQA